jgi:hypothetical protein
MVDAARRRRGSGLQEFGAAQGVLGEVAGGLSRLDELARRVATGDRVAFEAIYDETARDIFDYLSGSTRRISVAEDLAANVFLKAWGVRRGRTGSVRTRTGSGCMALRGTSSITTGGLRGWTSRWTSWTSRTPILRR